MRKRAVPLTTGSPSFFSAEVGPFQVTDAWFPPGLTLSRHYHERPIVATILSGEFDVVFPTETLQCRSATVFTEPIAERHGNRFGERGARVLVIEPDPARVELLHPCRNLLDRAGASPNVAATALARRLVHELHHEDELTPLAIEGLVLEFLAVASRLRAGATRSGPPPQWLIDTRDRLHDEFRRPPSLATLAGDAGVHPVRLSRTFRACFQTSIGTYVRGLRLEWGAQQLEQTEKTLSTIAIQAGFSDQSHFTRCFHRQLGVTPRRYRLLAGQATGSREAD